MRISLITKLTFCLICLFLYSSGIMSPLSAEEPIQLILNMKNEEALPRNFRTTRDPAKDPSQAESVNWQGLSPLQASASGQFSLKSLHALRLAISVPKILILDLRQESHGFLNGIAVSWWGEKNWANLSKTEEEIEKDESERLQELAQKRKTILIVDQKPCVIEAQEIKTERQLVLAEGLDYYRLPVLDHARPQDEAVDRFIRLIRQLPSDVWLHIHCAAGAGRSTLFMAMYDILKNAKQVSLEDILFRQFLIGGKNFLFLSEKEEWKVPLLLESVEFLQNFYQYCRERNDEEESWSSWSSQNL